MTPEATWWQSAGTLRPIHKQELVTHSKASFIETGFFCLSPLGQVQLDGGTDIYIFLEALEKGDSRI